MEGDFLARFKYVQDFTATATQLTLSGAFNFLNDVQLVVPSEPSKGILRSSAWARNKMMIRADLFLCNAAAVCP